MKRPSSDLLDRYFKNRCSSKEAAVVLEWLATSEGQAFYDKYLESKIEHQEELSMYSWHSEDEQETLEKVYLRINSKEKRQHSYYRVAAAVSVLLLSTLLWFVFQGQSSVLKVETAYGETQEIELSDGSKVFLNANSSLRYFPGKPREIWLDGEGYFEVQHTIDDAPFKVHTSDLVVNVLGTEFNINTRRKKTDVVLSTGKVSLVLQKAKQQGSMLMEPGEKISYSLEEDILEKKIVNPEAYTSWTKGTILFDHTPLEEVFQLMEDTYGVKVTVNDSSVLNKKLSGEVVQDIDVMITLLEKTFEINLSKEGQTIYLK